MIGGLVKDLVLRQTFMLDENLNYSELSSMKTPRYCPPAVMLMDNYIVVAGG